MFQQGILLVHSFFDNPGSRMNRSCSFTYSTMKRVNSTLPSISHSDTELHLRYRRKSKKEPGRRPKLRDCAVLRVNTSFERIARTYDSTVASPEMFGLPHEEHENIFILDERP